MASAKAFALVILIAALIPAYSQEPRATIRVEVTADSAPVAGASVSLSEVSLQTNENGVAIAPITLGNVEITVTKEGFHDATA